MVVSDIQRECLIQQDFWRGLTSAMSELFKKSLSYSDLCVCEHFQYFHDHNRKSAEIGVCNHHLRLLPIAHVVSNCTVRAHHMPLGDTGKRRQIEAAYQEFPEGNCKTVAKTFPLVLSTPILFRTDMNRGPNCNVMC